jgi:uncharacterized protein YjiS (DUF1127 family)
MKTLSDNAPRPAPAAHATARPTSRLARLVRETLTLARFVSDALRAARERRRLQRSLRHQAHVLSQLDARTLKDIGLHHSEIGSLMAELAERTDATRRHSRRAAADSVAPLY